MKTPRIPILCLFFATGFLYAQNPVPAVATGAATQTEFQKWLADLDAPWQAAFKRDVGDAYTAENDKLRGQYVAAMEAGLTKASGAGDLNGSIAWRNEQKRFAEANGIPAQDDAADPPAVKQLRTAWRSQLPRIETDHAARVKAMLAKYDQVLASAQTQLTKGNRIDDAILVKAKRDEVAAAWLAGIPSAPPVIAVKPTVPAKSPAIGGGVDVLPEDVPDAEKKGGFLISRKDVWIMSSERFRPPVAITYVFKTDSQVRLRYAGAAEIIFNWEGNKTELRIGGGPVNGQHRKGAGSIPVNKLLSIRLVVLPDKMTISVDGKERATWDADFSGVNQQVGVQSSHGSTVSVKQIPVEQIR